MILYNKFRRRNSYLIWTASEKDRRPAAGCYCWIKSLRGTLQTARLALLSESSATSMLRQPAILPTAPEGPI
jgi:hypothetical protein